MDRGNGECIRARRLSSIPSKHKCQKSIKVSSGVAKTSSDIIKKNQVEVEGKSRERTSHVRRWTWHLASEVSTSPVSSRKSIPKKIMRNPVYHVLEFQDVVTMDKYKIGLHKWMETPTRVRWRDRTEEEHTYSLCTLQANEENCPLRKCRIRDSCSTYTEACSKLAAIAMKEMDDALCTPPSHEDVDLSLKKRLRVSTTLNKDYAHSDDNFNYFSQTPKPLTTLKPNILRPDSESDGCSEYSIKVTSEIPGTSSSSLLVSQQEPQLPINLDNTPNRTLLKHNNSAEETREEKMFNMLRDIKMSHYQNVVFQSRVLEILSKQTKMLESLVRAVNNLNPDHPEDLVPFTVPTSNS